MSRYLVTTLKLDTTIPTEYIFCRISSKEDDLNYDLRRTKIEKVLAESEFYRTYVSDLFAPHKEAKYAEEGEIYIDYFADSILCEIKEFESDDDAMLWFELEKKGI